MLVEILFVFKLQIMHSDRIFKSCIGLVSYFGGFFTKKF